MSGKHMPPVIPLYTGLPSNTAHIYCDVPAVYTNKNWRIGSRVGPRGGPPKVPHLRCKYGLETNGSNQNVTFEHTAHQGYPKNQPLTQPKLRAYIWRKKTACPGSPEFFVGVLLTAMVHCAVVALPSDTTHISPSTARYMASLDTLVDDILIQILQALSVHAVLSLRKTSRRYYLLSKLRCVWYARFCAQVFARSLPIPGPSCPLSLLSATDLENRTLRALYLENCWPRLAANTIVCKQTDERVDQVVFIPGGTEFFTVQNDKIVHWLIVNKPGFSQGLKKVADWVPLEGVPCKVVKNHEEPSIIAVGARDQPDGFAKVLSSTLKAPFKTLCDYELVPGVVAGISRHLLLLDTTSELGVGGLELLDWHAQTTGTTLLPRIPDLFGDFVDFVLFAGNIVVAWENCMSVFPVPEVPAHGQAIVEHKRVFVFQESISRPIALTTCIARTSLDPIDRLYRPPPVTLPSLTIAARPKSKPGNVSMSMLVPLDDDDNMDNADTFPYRMTRLPPHIPGMPIAIDPAGGCVPQTCTNLCLGSSGRGIFVVGRELRLCGPGLLFLLPYEMQLGPVFETGEALYLMDGIPDSGVDGMSGGDSGGKVDFDEGMGRFVVAKGSGGFEVVQLD